MWYDVLINVDLQSSDIYLNYMYNSLSNQILPLSYTQPITDCPLNLTFSE